MSDDKQLVDFSPRRSIRVNKLKLDQRRADEFLQLVGRAYKENPDPKDLQEIRRFLIDFPEFCKAVYSLSDNLQETLISKMFDQDIIKVAIEEQTVNMRREFGYYEAPIMEQLMIENIILSWLRMYWLEYQITLRMGGQISMSVIEFWERRLSMSQRRYLAACESLAKIRKMAIPALQLNIGDKQVNVAGNLQSTPNSQHP
jgi:hypothetical protein